MAKPRRRPRAPVEHLDGPTPEQMGSGAYTQDFILYSEDGRKYLAHVKQGVEIDGRLFKERHFDRLNKAGQWSNEQYRAGCWYRDTHERGRYDAPSTSDLLKVNGCVSSIELSYSDRQRARDRWRVARQSIPGDMVGFIDALLLRNRWPKVHHRQRARTLDKVRDALDALVWHLEGR